VQKQDGHDNLAGAVPEGSNNTVTHTQTGAGHQHTVIEVGDGKTVTVTQSGKRTQ
jgi:hypothetical protein